MCDESGGGRLAEGRGAGAGGWPTSQESWSVGQAVEEVDGHGQAHADEPREADDGREQEPEVALVA